MSLTLAQALLTCIWALDDYMIPITSFKDGEMALFDGEMLELILRLSINVIFFEYSQQGI